MIKPNNYDNTTAAGEFTPIELGGHILVIKEVLEMTSKTGKPMLKISFDTASTDKQPNYFMEQYRNDTRQEKKWAANGSTYMMVEDKDGNCSRNFKTFITSVEKSNKGFDVQWGAGFSACFKEKLVGGVFGIVNDFYENKAIKKRQLRWFRSTEGVNEAEVPNETETTAYKNAFTNTQSSPFGNVPTDANGFMDIPEGIDEELPFN